MKTLIVTDFRAVKFNNRLYLASQHFFIIERYIEAFGETVLCSRFVDGDNCNGLHDITDLISDFVGFSSISDCFKSSFRRKLNPYIEKADLVIGRHPSIPAIRVFGFAQEYGKKMYAEVMGCAWDVYTNHGIKGRLLAPYMFLSVRRCVRNADYALYVTKDFLQKRYPNKGLSIGISDVKVDTSDERVIESKRLQLCKEKDCLTVMTIGDVDVLYKGQSSVIDAIPTINAGGKIVRYLLVGGGDPTYLKELAQKRGVLSQVEFLGKQPFDKVLELLDQVDIYIHPSLTEGLPRSLVEAMSRACPCLGSNAGGIPELLRDEYVFQKKSSSEIADMILKYSSIDKLLTMSRECFAKSKEYNDLLLQQQRSEFFNKVRNDIEIVKD